MESCVSFLRVSSIDQRDGFSLDAQGTLADKYVEDKQLSLVRNWAVDESAANHADRKHFFAMLEFVKANDVKNVVFDKIDRAVRNLESAVEIEKLIKGGVKFHFVREHLIIDDASPSHDKMRFYLGLILATYYVDNLRGEIKKGLDARTAVGLWNHIAPFGYKNIREGNANRAVVVFDEVEASIAKEVFVLYATGNYTLEALTAFIKKQIAAEECH
ncbi:MAG: recombinase family protein [Bdellovibrionales bacterium]|nr:recombinase family protein [Bdellovibrionales bacterium]